MSKVLQGNINGIILADILLDQWIAKDGPDLLLLSEPYRHPNDRTWIANADGKAAIWVSSGKQISKKGRGQNCATVANITFFSVYFSQNLTVGDFDT